MYAKKLCNILIELGIISLIIFPPIVFGAVQAKHITFIRIITYCIGVVWIVKTLVKGSITYVPGPVDLPVFLFFIVGIINLFTSTFAYNTENALYLFLSYVLLYFLVVQQLQTVRRIIGLAFIIILVGSGESLFGLIQYLRGIRTILGAFTPDVGTLNATYISHNHFAGFLVLTIPIALGLFAGTSNLEKKFFLFLVTGLMGVALVLTLSRGGLLSFFLAAIFFFTCALVKKTRSAKRRRVVHKYILLILLLAVFLIGYIEWIGISQFAHRSLFETFFPTQETLRKEIRFPLWKSALALVKESPVFGSGLGTFQYVFLRYRPDEIPQDKQAYRVHNDYLELLIETGFPGLLIALWAITRIFRYGLRGYFQHDDPVLTSLLLGGLTGCTALLIHSFLDFNLQIPANALLFSIVLGMTTGTIQLMERGRNKKPRTGTMNQNSRNRGKYRFKASWKFILIIICAFGILAWNFRKPVAMIYYRRAQQAWAEGQRFRPIPLYKKAMWIDRTNPLFHESLGKYYRSLAQTTPHKEKWYDLTVQEYKRAIALNAYNSIYYYYLGEVYDALGMEREAVQAFETAIAYNPGITLYYEHLGRYFLSIHQVNAALRRYKKALQIDPQRMPQILETCKTYKLSYEEYQQLVPENAESRKIFALLLARQGNWEASKTEYRRAIELSGGQPEYYDAMLEACQREHDYECMRTIWQEMWQQKPDKLELPINIAESFVQQQLWDQAIEQYRRIVKDHPDNVEILERLAQLCQQQGRTDDAIKAYKHILENQPDNAKIYHAIAGIYRQNKQWEAAIDVYETAIHHGLEQAAIYSALGDLYRQIDSEQNALEMYNRAIQAGESRIAIYQKVEQLYQAQQNKIDAELLWNTYTLVNKNNPEAVFQLVIHYKNAGEWLKAVTLSKELIASAPTNVNYRKFLADLYEQKGMLFESIEQWEKLVKMQSNNIEYRLYLAGLFEHVKQWENARMQYRKILRIQPNNQQAQQRLADLGE